MERKCLGHSVLCVFGFSISFYNFYLNSDRLLDSRSFVVSHGKSKVPLGSVKYKE